MHATTVTSSPLIHPREKLNKIIAQTESELKRQLEKRGQDLTVLY